MIKTIVVDEEELLDKRVNEFEQDPKNSVFATQTHVTYLGDNSNGMAVIQYTAVIFYKVRL